MRTSAFMIAALGLLGPVSLAAAAPGKRGAQDHDPYLAMNRLLVANGCSNCHAADYLRVGPAMTDIATMYASATPEEIATVRHNVAAGTKGKWGIAIMPAQKHVTPERADEIVRTILALNRKSAK